MEASAPNPLLKVHGCKVRLAVGPCPQELCHVSLSHMAPTTALLRPAGFPLVSLGAALLLSLAQEALALYQLPSTLPSSIPSTPSQLVEMLSCC